MSACVCVCGSVWEGGCMWPHGQEPLTCWPSLAAAYESSGRVRRRKKRSWLPSVTHSNILLTCTTGWQLIWTTLYWLCADIGEESHPSLTGKQFHITTHFFRYFSKELGIFLTVPDIVHYKCGNTQTSWTIILLCVLTGVLRGQGEGGEKSENHRVGRLYM